MAPTGCPACERTRRLEGTAGTFRENAGGHIRRFFGDSETSVDAYLPAYAALAERVLIRLIDASWKVDRSGDPAWVRLEEIMLAERANYLSMKREKREPEPAPQLEDEDEEA